MAYNMSNRAGQPRYNRANGQDFDPERDLANRMSDRELQFIEEKLGPIAYKITNDEGEVDLHKLTGEEALKFLSTFGVTMGRVMA